MTGSDGQRWARLPLSEQQVIDIKLRLAAHEAPRAICRDLGLSEATVYGIRRGDHFRDVTVVPELAKLNGAAADPIEGWISARRVHVRTTPEAFALQIRKHLPSPEDRQRIIDLIKDDEP